MKPRILIALVSVMLGMTAHLSAADASLGRNGEGKRVRAGMHEDTKEQATPFDATVSMDSLVQLIDARVTSGDRVMEFARVRALDIEKFWLPPRRVECVSSHTFTGLFIPWEFKDGGYFSKFDGKMKVEPGEPGSGSGGGGTTENDQEVDLTWSFLGELRATDVVLIAMPKVLAADSRADIPIFFKVKGVDEVTIKKVTVEMKLEEMLEDSVVSNGSKRLLGGDASREKNGSGAANGETNEYTIFVPKGFYDIDLSHTGHYRGDDVEQRLLVDYVDEDGNTISGKTAWVPLDGFLDRNIDICHLGSRYSNNGEADYPALNPGSGISRDLWREAVPFTRQMKQQKHWLTGPDDRGFWFRHTAKRENRQWCPEIAFGYRCRNAPWIHPRGTYNLTVLVDSGNIPSEWSSNEDQWMEMLSNEERNCIFVWYWGVKEVKDLAGQTLDSVDVRIKSTPDATVHLYPDAQVDLGVTKIDDPVSGWSGGTAGAILSIVGGVVTIASGPPGWITTALAYATVASASATVLQDTYGEFADAPDEKEGAQATAFGFVTKNNSDGSPRPDKFYGDGQAGLGGPNADEFTQKENGQKTKTAGVLHGAGTVALNTWKVSHAMSVAAWATEEFWFHRDANAWLRFTLASGPDARFCRIDSLRNVTGPEEQWVGEED